MLKVTACLLAPAECTPPYFTPACGYFLVAFFFGAPALQHCDFLPSNTVLYCDAFGVLLPAPKVPHLHTSSPPCVLTVLLTAFSVEPTGIRGCVWFIMVPFSPPLGLNKAKQETETETETESSCKRTDRVHNLPFCSLVVPVSVHAILFLTVLFSSAPVLSSTRCTCSILSCPRPCGTLLLLFSMSLVGSAKSFALDAPDHTHIWRWLVWCAASRSKCPPVMRMLLAFPLLHLFTATLLSHPPLILATSGAAAFTPSATS